jgi:hypothetical protein
LEQAGREILQEPFEVNILEAIQAAASAS